METIKEDIHQELRRLRLDKKHLYNTLLKIIDTIPQAETSVVPTETQPVAEVPVVETPPVPEPEVPVVEKVETPPVPEPEVPVVEASPMKKNGGRKKKSVTVQA